MVYDVGKPESFASLGQFMAEAKKFGPKGGSVPGVLCANKVDQRRAVSEAEGRDFARAHGLAYFETSASTGASVNEVFEHAFSEALRGAGQ